MMAVSAPQDSADICGRRCGEAMVDDVVLCADEPDSEADDSLGMPVMSPGETEGLPTGRAMLK